MNPFIFIQLNKKNVMNQKQIGIFLRIVLLSLSITLSISLAIASPVAAAILFKEVNVFLLTLIGSSSMVFFLLIFVALLVNRNEIIRRN